MARNILAHVITKDNIQYKIQDTGNVWTLSEKKQNQKWTRLGSRSDGKLLIFELDEHYLKGKEWKPVNYENNRPVFPSFERNKKKMRSVS